MLSQYETAVAVGPCFVGSEEIWVLKDIVARCYFPSAKEREGFMKKVCKSVRAKCVQEILEDDFETAFNTAMVMLRERGEKILGGKVKDNLAKGMHIHGIHFPK